MKPGFTEPTRSAGTDSDGAQFEPDRDPVEVLAAEFVDRYRRGEFPSIEEYAGQNPAYADSIRELFPTIAAVEQLKIRKELSGGGRASLGHVQLERLGDFRIVREIGRGGMGIVYEAEQESLGRRVAVKVLPKQSLLDPKHLKRFQREAQTAAKLHHTNIVPVFGVGHADGFHFIVMQLIRGVALDALLERLEHTASTVVQDSVAQDSRSQPSTTSDRRGGNATDVDSVARALLAGKLGEPRESSGSGSNSGTASTGERTGSAAAGANVPTSPPAIAAPLAATQELSGIDPTQRVSSGELSEDAAAVFDFQRPQLGAPYWCSVARIGLQVAGALQYAHAQGTLHRDVKPGNLLLDARGVVWISDFGLAKAMQHDDVSRTGDIVGTLRYMAPEQFGGQVDGRSDVFSLGLTLYELLTLRPAFEASDHRSLVQRITHDEPIRPRKVEPRIPRDLETIVLKAIARDPGHRYQSAAQLEEDLQCFLDDRPIQARRTTSVERAWRWCRRNRLVASLAGIALMLLVTVAVVASIGYARTRRANQQMNEALIGETLQRERAEATAELAQEALDNMFEQFAPSRVGSTTELSVSGTEGEEYEMPAQPVLSRETAAILENMLVFYDRLAEQSNDDSRLQEKAAEANRRVGDIQQRLGQWQAAESAYSRAVAKYHELGSEAYQMEIAKTQNELGSVYSSTNQVAKAREAHLAALELLDAVDSDAGATPETRYEKARTYFLLARRPLPSPGGPHGGVSGGRGPGSHFAAPGRPPGGPEDRADRRRPHFDPDRGPRRPGDEGHEFIEKAIAVLEQLAVEQPGNPDYRYLLACCYRELPSEWRRPGGGNAAAREKAIDMLESLVADFPDVPDYRYELSETYAKIDFRSSFHRQESDGTAEAQLRKALENAEQLVAEHPNIPRYAMSVVHIRLRLGHMLRHGPRGAEDEKREERLAEAEECFRRAASLQATLVEQFPDVASYKVWLAMSRESLAKLLLDRDRPKLARALLDSAIEVLSPLVEADPEAHEFRGPLAFCYRMQAEALRQLGEDALADEAEGRARELRPSMPHRSFDRRRGKFRGEFEPQRRGDFDSQRRGDRLGR